MAPDLPNSSSSQFSTLFGASRRAIDNRFTINRGPFDACTFVLVARMSSSPARVSPASVAKNANKKLVRVLSILQSNASHRLAPPSPLALARQPLLGWNHGGEAASGALGCSIFHFLSPSGQPAGRSNLVCAAAGGWKGKRGECSHRTVPYVSACKQPTLVVFNYMINRQMYRNMQQTEVRVEFVEFQANAERCDSLRALIDSAARRTEESAANECQILPSTSGHGGAMTGRAKGKQHHDAGRGSSRH